MGGRGAGFYPSGRGKTLKKYRGGTASPLEHADRLHIADWKLREISREYAGHLASDYPTESDIVRETEKAVYLSLNWETPDGEYERQIKVWVPKSAIQTEEQYRKTLVQERERYEEGKRKYAKMLAFAKEHKVPGVRNKMRKQTILAKIRAAGYDYEY